MKQYGALFRYLARRFFLWACIVLLALAAIIWLVGMIELLRRSGTRETATFDVVLEMSALKLPAMLELMLPFAVLFRQSVRIRSPRTAQRTDRSAQRRCLGLAAFAAGAGGRISARFGKSDALRPACRCGAGPVRTTGSNIFRQHGPGFVDFPVGLVASGSRRRQFDNSVRGPGRTGPRTVRRCALSFRGYAELSESARRQFGDAAPGALVPRGRLGCRFEGCPGSAPCRNGPHHAQLGTYRRQALRARPRCRSGDCRDTSGRWRKRVFRRESTSSGFMPCWPPSS